MIVISNVLKPNAGPHPTASKKVYLMLLAIHQRTVPTGPTVPLFGTQLFETKNMFTKSDICWSIGRRSRKANDVQRCGWLFRTGWLWSNWDSGAMPQWWRMQLPREWVHSRTWSASDGSAATSFKEGEKMWRAISSKFTAAAPPNVARARHYR